MRITCPVPLFERSLILLYYPGPRDEVRRGPTSVSEFEVPLAAMYVVARTEQSSWFSKSFPCASDSAGTQDRAST